MLCSAYLQATKIPQFSNSSLIKPQQKAKCTDRKDSFLFLFYFSFFGEEETGRERDACLRLNVKSGNASGEFLCSSSGSATVLASSGRSIGADHLLVPSGESRAAFKLVGGTNKAAPRTPPLHHHPPGVPLYRFPSASVCSSCGATSYLAGRRRVLPRYHRSTRALRTPVRERLGSPSVYHCRIDGRRLVVTPRRWIAFLITASNSQRISSHYFNFIFAEISSHEMSHR